MNPLNPHSQPSDDVFDALAGELLTCTAVISTMINGMMDCVANGSSPDAPPVPVVAQMVIRDALVEVGARHPASEIASAAAIIEEAIEAICESVYTVGDDAFECEARRHGARFNARRR